MACRSSPVGRMEPPQGAAQRPIHLNGERPVLRGGDQGRGDLPEFQIALPRDVHQPSPGCRAAAWVRTITMPHAWSTTARPAIVRRS